MPLTQLNFKTRLSCKIITAFSSTVNLFFWWKEGLLYSGCVEIFMQCETNRLFLKMQGFYKKFLLLVYPDIKDGF